MRAFILTLAACAVASCATAPTPNPANAAAAATSGAASDAASGGFSEAVRAAHVRECPADRTRADARASGEAQTAGVRSEDIALTPLAADPTRAVRLRRLIVAPGGTIAWHDHAAIQGMAMIVSGEIVETRNSCLDTLLYRAGDIAREDAATAHSWRNESDADAVILAAHVVPR